MTDLQILVVEHAGCLWTIYRQLGPRLPAETIVVHDTNVAKIEYTALQMSGNDHSNDWEEDAGRAYLMAYFGKPVRKVFLRDVLATP